MKLITNCKDKSTVGLILSRETAQYLLILEFSLKVVCISIFHFLTLHGKITKPEGLNTNQK